MCCPLAVAAGWEAKKAEYEHMKEGTNGTDFDGGDP